MCVCVHIYVCVCVWVNQVSCIAGGFFIVWGTREAYAERRRIDAFELWCWRRLLRVPWTARRSNQPILKEISPGISLEGMMLKLKLQYFGYLMQRVDSLEKTPMLGGIGGRRRRGHRGWDGWMASLTRWTWAWVNSGSWWWTGRPGVLRFMGSQRVGRDWATDLIWSDIYIHTHTHIYVYIYATSSLAIHLSTGVEVVSISWLL